jgi:hypothetical protein
MKFTLTIAVLTGAALCAFPVLRADPTKSITVGELNQLQVIGWLGQPLGKIITVEGVAADENYHGIKQDAGQTLLRIQVVDGKVLPEECVFHFGEFSHYFDPMEKPKVGSKFKYIGYETGGFTGVQPGLFEYTAPFASTGYAFTTHFVVLRDELKPKQVIQADDKVPAPPGPPR